MFFEPALLDTQMDAAADALRLELGDGLVGLLQLRLGGSDSLVELMASRSLPDRGKLGAFSRELDALMKELILPGSVVVEEVPVGRVPVRSCW